MYSKGNMKKSKMKNILHIVLFILFLTIFPEGYIVGTKRVIATFTLAFIVSYSITQNLKTSGWTALIFTFIAGLLDENGPFSDLRGINHYETFEVKPAGKSAKDRGNQYSSSETQDSDNTNFDDEDLDKILSDDEKQSSKENETLKEAGGGLDQLKDLLEMTRKEAPYAEKDIADYTPAQAQRATYHLIDTVKQLKETMTSMMPLMKAGKNLIGLHKQFGGEEFTKALQS